MPTTKEIIGAVVLVILVIIALVLVLVGAFKATMGMSLAGVILCLLVIIAIIVYVIVSRKRGEATAYETI